MCGCPRILEPIECSAAVRSRLERSALVWVPNSRVLTTGSRRAGEYGWMLTDVEWRTRRRVWLRRGEGEDDEGDGNGKRVAVMTIEDEIE